MPNLTAQQTAAKVGSGLIGNPLTGPSSTSSLVGAVGADEAALFGSKNTGAFPDIVTTALTAPAVSITQGGTAGSTNYTYVVADMANNSAAPTSTQTTTGNATLSSTNTNVISFSTVAGHLYNIYRSASSGTPSGTGSLFTSVVGTGVTMSVIDSGQTAGTAQIPTGNTSGGESIAGPSFLAGVFSGCGSAGVGGKVTLNSAGTTETLTTTQLFADVFVRTGGTTTTSTTPTAAAIVAAAGPAAVAGGIRRWVYRNEGSGTATLGAGSGVTLRAGDTATILTIAAREFFIVLTTVTPGSEAVEIISGATSAY